MFVFSCYKIIAAILFLLLIVAGTSRTFLRRIYRTLLWDLFLGISKVDAHFFIIFFIVR